MRQPVLGWGALAVVLVVGGSGDTAGQPAPPLPGPTPAPTAAAVAGVTIHEAAMEGDLETVKRLVGADAALVNAASEDGITPLAFAAAFGRTEVVAFLADRGADVNARDRRGITALYLAVWRNRPEIVRLLLKKGADCTVSGPGGLSPLHVAAMNAHTDIARLLIDRKVGLASHDAYGNTPLHLAAATNPDVGMVRLLVDAGADVNTANSFDGSTALDLARREGRTAVANFLRSRGARAGTGAARALRGPYLGQAPPGATPVVFARNLVSTETTELCAVFSADGTEFYFARSERERGARMRTVTRENGVWGDPGPVAFVGDYTSVDMFISRGGQSLYFCSNRAPDGKGPAKKDADIWVATRGPGGWGEPVNLGGAVNSAENDDYPTLTDQGDLYFSSPRPGGAGGSDIYRARRKEGRLGPAENLGSPINTENWEFDPFIAPDESFIVFASDRPGTLGDADLYISVRISDGSWSPPRNLGAPINSIGPEYTPMLSPDGTYLFFASGRGGPDDIYWVDAAAIDSLRR